MEDLNFNPGFTQSCGGNGNKRKSTGIDLNKKPQQRQRRYKPKIFDALKPKKSPKTPDTKKYPKKQNRKKRREACLSEQISELNPKTPCPDVELCPTTPRPKIFSQFYERRKYGSRRTLEFKSENFLQEEGGCKFGNIELERQNGSGRPKNLSQVYERRKYGARRTLDFKLENSIQEEGGGKLGNIEVERQDGGGNIEVERPQGGGKVDDIEAERQEDCGKVDNIEVERLSIFNTFTSGLELPPEEDFDGCMKKVVEEYRNEILHAQCSLAECLISFPDLFKKPRRRRMRKKVHLNLLGTIGLFKGERAAKKRRSRKLATKLSITRMQKAHQNTRKASQNTRKARQNTRKACQNTHMYVQSIGIPPDIDSLVQMFESLHISHYPKTNKKSAKSLYLWKPLELKKKKRLVAQKKRILAKVALDEETMRVWNMLMGNATQVWKRLGSDEAMQEEDGEDAVKAKYWKEEIQKFRKMVDAFLIRMKVIQGNHKYSPWKGSVIDSGVGVFLTQNVSDCLSSSAYMELASRFPIANQHNESMNPDLLEEGSGSGLESMGSSGITIDSSFRSSDSTCRGNVLQVEDNMDVLSNRVKEEVMLADNVLGSFHTGSEIDVLESVHEDEVLKINVDDNVEPVKDGMKDDSSGDRDLDKSPCLNCDCSTPLREDSNFKTKAGGRKGEANKEKKTGMKGKRKSSKKREKKVIDWEEMRRMHSIPQHADTMDSVDWNAVSMAPVEEISDAISGRGQNNVLARRIKAFLEDVLKNDGNLEWLRNAPDNVVQEYLLRKDGLGLKSVECIRLLSLFQHAFPVDTNVGRIVVRLGWVPLQPLPEGVEFDEIQYYPNYDDIQKYLWARLCMLTKEELYELHYQLITFGKVFCTKVHPNCNACPLKGECRHFASASARSRLNLPAPQPTCDPNQESVVELPRCPDPNRNLNPVVELPPSPEPTRNLDPVVELPPSPEINLGFSCGLIDEEGGDVLDTDIEDFAEIHMPTVTMNREEEILAHLSQELELYDKSKWDLTKALVPMGIEFPDQRSKKQIISRLRNIHKVYVLEDGHRLLETFDKREIDDPCPYLLATWKSSDSIHASSSGDPNHGNGLVESDSNNAGDSRKENNNNNKQIRGTILIPSRTAMRGRFPLNGTYFQINEVFADDETSKSHVFISKEELSHLEHRPLYCGTSATSIFKGMTMVEVQHCCWKGFICVRGFNRRTRGPKPLCPLFRMMGDSAPKNKKDLFSKEWYEYEEE